MKQALSILLGLLLAFFLALPAMAEVITIDLENATYEELIAAHELLEAARIARLKKIFAETHEVQLAEGITFRGVPWGSTKTETEKIIGAPYRCYDHMYRKYQTLSIYNDGRGINAQYSGWTIAGYKLTYAIVNYVYPVHDGKLLRDSELAVMCYCTYILEDIGDVDAVRDDLTNKLNLLYGVCTYGSNNSRKWIDENGHSVTLSSGSSSVYLHYVHADSDALTDAAEQAIAAERAEQEELLRIQNQNNVEGL